MARRTISIDEKIDRAKDVVSRAKVKYEAALEELEKLMVKKEEIKKQELMEAKCIIRKHSCLEISLLYKAIKMHRLVLSCI